MKGVAVVLLQPHLEEQVDFLQLVPLVFQAVDDLLQLAVRLLNLLGDLGVVPEVGGEGLLFQPLQLVFLLSQVKDAPSGPGGDPSIQLSSVSKRLHRYQAS
jgi:hypothetical protein